MNTRARMRNLWKGHATCGLRNPYCATLDLPEILGQFKERQKLTAQVVLKAASLVKRYFVPSSKLGVSSIAIFYKMYKKYEKNI